MEMNEQRKERFYNGEMFDAYRFFGCTYKRGQANAEFRVFAPRAKRCAVVGDFNNWDTTANEMSQSGGIWHCKVKGVKEFDGYKYFIETEDGRTMYKSDPFAFHAETRPGTNSKVYDWGNFSWSDASYFQNKTAPYDKPMNIYEAHIGSWRKFVDGNFFSYRKFADEMAEYLKEMKYTHIELMGISEYPFDGSWGYQVTGYFAPTSRYGLPEDFAYLVDKMHQNGIAVILDWVPGHFPKDANGLYEFDGFPLYEPEDELRREHKEWGTCCFDYGRGEVQSFLISNAMYWLDVFHADGLRVDAVASMLYHDYDRREWRPNIYGGTENLEAIAFFRRLNSAVFSLHPNALMIAEESTAWPLVTKPVSEGGLGFNFKWNMGWMNDSLSYAKTDPYFRSGNHDKLTFSMSYAFSENYILPVSHDEIVHGKGSLIGKMPGEYAEKFAGWRNYMMYMFSHPGKKLTMMGTELAQFGEWNFEKELDWMLLDYPVHREAQAFVKALNTAYVQNPAFWQIEDGWDGFQWRVVDDFMQNVIVYERADLAGNRILCVLNFANAAWENYRFGAAKGSYQQILYSDNEGWNETKKRYKTEEVASHGMTDSIVLNIPPLCGIYMKKEASAPKAAKPSTQDKPKKPPVKKAEASKKPASQKPPAKKAAASAKDKPSAKAPKTAAKSSASKQKSKAPSDKVKPSTSKASKATAQKSTAAKSAATKKPTTSTKK